MSKGIIIFLSIFLFSCSTEDENAICERGFGYLYKNGKEFACPFNLQIKTANKVWIDYEGQVTVLDSTVGDYFPLKRRNSPYTYRVKMSGLKEYLTEEQYIVSLGAVYKNRKLCGESKEFIFYKISEKSDSVEYNSVLIDSIEHGRYLFFGLREMPSYNWYHVLNVSCGGKIGFTLIGEIKE